MIDNKYAKAWEDKFCELCHHVFVKSKEGAELLKMLEDKFFRSPVAYPNQEPSWAYFNEGRNDMIRQFSASINKYVSGQRESSKQRTVKHKVR